MRCGLMVSDDRGSGRRLQVDMVAGQAATPPAAGQRGLCARQTQERNIN